MPGPIIFRVGSGQGRIGWLRLLIIVLIASGLLFIVAVLAFSLLIVLAPLMLLAGILSYFFPGLRPRARQRPPSAAGDTIDVDYRVVEPDRDGQQPKNDLPRLK